MMNTKKMKKSVAALAFATGLLIVGGGFIISNMMGAAMPVVYADAGEIVQSGVVQNEAVQNEMIQSEVVQYGNYVTTMPVSAIPAPPQNISPVVEIATQENDTVQNQFQWPLYGEYTRITSTFGMRTNPITERDEFHTGIDIPAPEGTPVLAAKDGYVVTALSTPNDTWLGIAIVLYHGELYHREYFQTVYAHLSAVHVEEGQFVRQGEHIADVGSTGEAVGSHLHFEIRNNSHSIDPLDFLSRQL